MAFPAVSLSFASSSSIASLLQSSSAVSASTPALPGSSSGNTDAVTVDLTNYRKAVSSGDTSAKTGALKQLKADLASNQASRLSSLVASAFTGTTPSSSLLSSIYGRSSANVSGSILDTKG